MKGRGWGVGWGRLLCCPEVPWLASGPHLQLEGFILLGGGERGWDSITVLWGSPEHPLK